MRIPDNVGFTQNPADALRDFLERHDYSKIVVIVDENTRQHCYNLIAPALSDPLIINVPSGEEHKTIATSVQIWEKLTSYRVDRHGCVIVLGGGVLGDMGGFCAATYKRGIDFVLVPTTLLAQTDASIGGKLGVDFDHYKNHIGVFRQPALTLLYGGFLKTLPLSELRSGFAEIIKHTLISDREMWKKVSSADLADQPWDELVAHSVAFKARVTTEDPTEKGLRKILNAGHTIGHALETHLLLTGKKIAHGEAVAVGLITEAHIAFNRGLLTGDDLNEISRYILRIYPRVPIDTAEEDDVCRLMMQDKKNKGNKVLCVLLNGIGHAQWDYEISTDEVRSALAYYRSL